MLKKINRLAKRKEFEELKKEGRKLYNPLFGLLYKIASEGKKVGFIVSKRISKRAVDRNRIRRLLAEGVRNNLNLLPEGFKGLFLVTKQMLGKKLGEVDEKMGKIVKLIK